MCLIFVAIDAHPKYRIVVAANRDEFYDRPTAPASFWRENPDILAGRDLLAGGTWLGITRTGRIAALTNYRDRESFRADAPSRGRVVSGYLMSTEPPLAYLEQLSRTASRYNGFSLLAGKPDKIYCYSNRGSEIRVLSPGIHGLSNHLLDTPWPKVEKGKKEIARILDSKDISIDDLFQLLQDRVLVEDRFLPDTGVDLEWERTLSPIFISSPSYGTRSSTVILLDRSEMVTFVERCFDRGTESYSTVAHRFTLQDSRFQIPDSR